MALLKNTKIAIINGIIFKNKFFKGTILINHKKIKKVVKGNIYIVLELFTNPVSK